MVFENAISTRRVFLRPWKMEDAEDLFEYARDPQVGPNAGWEPHETKEESRAVIQLFTDPEKPAMVFAMEDRESGRVIGSVGIEPDVRRPGVEKALSLGYALSRSYWGKGLMTEACEAVIDYVFQTRQAKILSITHYPENDRSRRVIEKCGFRFEGRLSQATVLYNGDVRDLCFYSMTAAEYYRKQAEKRGLSLILPEEAKREEIEVYREAWGKERIIPGSLKRRGEESLDEWLKQNIAGRSFREDSKLVTSHTYFLTDPSGALLGAVDLRHHLTDALFRTGGHIGYGIRPSCRGKNYAPCMLALCLEKAKERGIERVLVTCREENRASAAVIEACGGVMENRIEENGECFRRYWIAQEGGK